MNFSTTCLRYSKFISLESFKSELLVTVTEALGTSEFVRSSGTSLSGLIFYKTKQKKNHRRKRSALQMLLAWHWEESGFRVSKEGCTHKWVHSGHQQLLILHGVTAEKCLSPPYTPGQELVDVSVMCTLPKPAWNWLHGGKYPLVIFSYH